MATPLRAKVETGVKDDATQDFADKGASGGCHPRLVRLFKFLGVVRRNTGLPVAVGTATTGDTGGWRYTKHDGQSGLGSRGSGTTNARHIAARGSMGISGCPSRKIARRPSGNGGT